jgi:prevent-host-death family protein
MDAAAWAAALWQIPGDMAIIMAILELKMASYSVAEAKNQLPSLIDKALGGEDVVITRHGKPVAELRPPRARPSSEERKALYDHMAAEAAKRPVSVSAVDLLNEMYEEKPW